MILGYLTSYEHIQHTGNHLVILSFGGGGSLGEGGRKRDRGVRCEYYEQRQMQKSGVEHWEA